MLDPFYDKLTQIRNSRLETRSGTEKLLLKSKSLIMKKILLLKHGEVINSIDGILSETTLLVNKTMLAKMD